MTDRIIILMIVIFPISAVAVFHAVAIVFG